MAQCAAKLKDGTPCKIPAKEGQRYCHIHKRSRTKWQWVWSGIAAFILLLGGVADATDILGRIGIYLPSLPPTPIPIPAILPPTQMQVINSTATPKGTLNTIRFVAGPIPADGGGHNVYYSVDNGAEQLLATMGANIDKTFFATFSRSIHVWVEITPGTVLHEELYINGEQIVSGDFDYNGIFYSGP